MLQKRKLSQPCLVRSSNGFSPRESTFHSVDDDLQILQLLSRLLRRRMNLLKILRKICCHRCHEDHWGLDQDETKIKTSAQLLQAFDALTPEDKLKVLIEIMLSCEKLKATTGLDSYFLEEQEVRLLKESIKVI